MSEASGSGPGGPPAVVLIQGEDPALVAEAARSVVGRIVGVRDRALLVEEHQGGEDDISSVLDACNTASLLSDHRVVVVRDAGRLRAGEVDALCRYAGAPSASASLVLVAGGGALPQKLSAAVRRAGEVVQAGAPGGRGRAGWLAERLAGAPVKLDAEARSLLEGHLGEDLGRLQGLLDAVSAAHAPGARIGARELEPFLGEMGSIAPWVLTDAIDAGDTSAAIEALHRLLDAGERHPLAVLALLHRHYAGMLRLDGSGAASGEEAAALLGARSAFAAGKQLAQARRLGGEGVGRAVQLLAAADLDLRGRSGLPGELVLEVLVGRLCRLAPRRPPQRGSSRRR